MEMGQTQSDLTVYYDDVKNNMVKVLNEIVENYVYRDPNKKPYEGSSNFQNWSRTLKVLKERMIL
jgi:hypothetical protein